MIEFHAVADRSFGEGQGRERTEASGHRIERVGRMAYLDDRDTHGKSCDASLRTGRYTSPTTWLHPGANGIHRSDYVLLAAIPSGGSKRVAKAIAGVNG